MVNIANKVDDVLEEGLAYLRNVLGSAGFDVDAHAALPLTIASPTATINYNSTFSRGIMLNL